VALTTFATSAIGMITTLLLPKMLSPEAFGLFTLGGLINNLAVKVTGLGQGEYVIYKQNNEERVQAVSFTTYLASNLIFFILQIILAKTLAAYFHNTLLAPIYFWTAGSYLITSFNLIPNSVLSKRLDFKRKFWPEFYGVVVYTMVALTLAWKGYGVWALVFSGLSSNLITMIGLWISSGWRPKLCWDRAVAKEMFSYGLPLMANGILVYLWFNMDRFFIGKYLDAKQLGYYTVAFQFAYLLPMKLNQIVTTVLFPAYSSLDEKDEERSSIFRRSFTLTGFLAGLIAVLTYYLAKPFIFYMYGGGWQLTAEVMRIFAVFSFASIISAPMVSLLMSLGLSRWLMYSTLLGLAMAGVLIIMTVSHGVIAVAWSMTAAVYIYVAALIFFCYRRISSENKSRFIISIFSSLLSTAALLMIANHLGKHIYGSGLAPLTSNIIVALIVSLAFILFHLSINRDLGHDIMRLMRRR